MVFSELVRSGQCSRQDQGFTAGGGTVARDAPQPPAGGSPRHPASCWSIALWFGPLGVPGQVIMFGQVVQLGVFHRPLEHRPKDLFLPPHRITCPVRKRGCCRTQLTVATYEGCRPPDVSCGTPLLGWLLHAANTASSAYLRGLRAATELFHVLNRALTSWYYGLYPALPQGESAPAPRRPQHRQCRRDGVRYPADCGSLLTNTLAAGRSPDRHTGGFCSAPFPLPAQPCTASPRVGICTCLPYGRR